MTSQPTVTGFFFSPQSASRNCAAAPPRASPGSCGPVRPFCLVRKEENGLWGARGVIWGKTLTHRRRFFFLEEERESRNIPPQLIEEGKGIDMKGAIWSRRRFSNERNVENTTRNRERINCALSPECTISRLFCHFGLKRERESREGTCNSIKTRGVRPSNGRRDKVNKHDNNVEKRQKNKTHF